METIRRIQCWQCKCIDRANGKDIVCISGEGDGVPLRTFSIHLHPIRLIHYNAIHDSGISIDQKGFIEYWSPGNGELPAVQFSSKLETDLFDLVRHHSTCRSLTISPNGELFALYCSDRYIRLYHFLSARLLHTYNETIALYERMQEDPASPFRLERIEFLRRMALERELDRPDSLYSPGIEFDDSSSILIYSTYVGIKFINIADSRILRLLGKHETERFTQISLFGGKLMRNMSGRAGVGGSSSQGDKVSDPTLFALAFRKNRFYLFTKNPPADLATESGESIISRDIMNEKPSKEEAAYALPKSATSVLASKAIIHTTMGDIYIKLYPKETPRAVENFTALAKSGYYDQIVFHRVSRGFMVQTGDPDGDGTGGQSVWGEEFEDEFHPNLKHDRPFTVSMANKGPDSNGSQFFITVVPATWLDGRHTIFGRVYKGMDVVQTIEGVPVDRQEKPMAAIRITHVSVDA